MIGVSGASPEINVSLRGPGGEENVQPGSVIVATGFKHFDPGKETQMYGYYEFDDVITLVDTEKMLKAKVIDMHDVIYPEMGTPQGSVLSPILCNVALNGLEAVIKNKALELRRPILKRGGNPKVHVVRYADDFIVIGPSKKMLVALRPCIESFLAERGLEISKAKSSLFNIWEQDIESR